MSNQLIQSVADKVLSDPTSSNGSQSQNQTDMLYVGKSVNSHEIHGIKDPADKSQNTDVKDNKDKEPIPPVTGTWPYNPQIASSYLPGELTKVIHDMDKSPIDKELEQQQIALAQGGIVAIQALATMQQPTPIVTGDKKGSDSKVVSKVAVVA